MKVSSGTTTVYIFSGGKVIAEYDNSALVGSPSREYIYSGSALLAKIDSTGTKYYHRDHLSNRLVTDSSGATSAQMGHFPFGESWYNATNDKLLFTSYERDSESGNDYAKARYFMSRLGRFSSSDPLSGSTSNPQSLNRYDYAADDPTDLEDPSGLCPYWGPFGINGRVICTSAHGPSGRDIVDWLVVFDYSGWVLGGEYAYPIATYTLVPVYGPSYAYFGGGGGGNPGGTDRIAKVKGLAEWKVGENEKCRKFIEQLLAKIYGGVPGQGNSNATTISSGILNSTYTYSETPNTGFPDANMMATGPSSATIYPPGAELSNQGLAVSFIHEAIHGVTGRNDRQIVSAMNGGRWTYPNTTEGIAAASRTWGGQLRTNCE